MSVNEVAEATGMAWATVRKFASSLEDLRVLAPELEIKPNGILVRRASPRVARVASEPMSTAALYIHIHARLLGNPSHPILLSQHTAFAENFSNPLKELVSLGLAEMESGSVNLTAQGISFASNLLESILAPELLEEIEDSESPFETPVVTTASMAARGGRRPTRTLLRDQGLLYPVNLRPLNPIPA